MTLLLARVVLVAAPIPIFDLGQTWGASKNFKEACVSQKADQMKIENIRMMKLAATLTTCGHDPCMYGLE